FAPYGLEIRKRRLCNSRFALGLDPFRAGIPLSIKAAGGRLRDRTDARGRGFGLTTLGPDHDTRSAITRRFSRSDNVRSPQQAIPARKQPSARGSRPLPRRNSLVSKPKRTGTPPA